MSGSWMIQLSSSGIKMFNRMGYSGKFVPFSTNQWHWLAVVKHGSEAVFYLDGVKADTHTGLKFDCPITLGGLYGDYSYYPLSGNIQEYRLQYLNSAEMDEWTGATIPVPTEPYSVARTEGGWTKLNKSELASKNELSRRLLLQRPVTDREVYPKIEASGSPDFSDPVTLDPRGTTADRSSFQVYTGRVWNDFPAEGGLGTPFDGMMVAADTGTFAALPLPYYVRYCWVEPDGTESNYESTIFPSVQTFPPQESGASAPSGGAAISRMLLVRPVTDQALFPKVEAAKNADFSDARLLDPRAVPADLDCFKVFDGSVWGDFPAEGLGTPFDNMSVAVEMSRFASFGETCFVRYCWIAADGTETDWKSTLFPVSATPPNAVAAGPAGGGKISVNGTGGVTALQFAGAAVSVENGTASVTISNTGSAGRPDVEVSAASLDSEGAFLVENARPGCFAVCDSTGKLIIPPQYKVSGNMKIDFSGQADGPWTISFISGSITEEQIQDLALQMAIVMS